MLRGMTILRFDRDALGAPKSFEVDPLEYLAARIATSAAPGLDNEIEYLIVSVSKLVEDDELWGGHKTRFSRRSGRCARERMRALGSTPPTS